MTPAQALEAGVVAIRGDPLATGFDRQGSEVGVGDQWAARPALATQTGKDVPVTDARADDDAVGPVEECGSEGERFVEFRGRRNARGLVTMRINPDRTSSDTAKLSSASLTSSSQRRYRE